MYIKSSSYCNKGDLVVVNVLGLKQLEILY